MRRYSRRTFLAAVAAASNIHENDSKLSDVDFGKLVSRADLTYDRPVQRSEEGIPIGNGRMGSLAWTSPTQLHFQINRVEVYRGWAARRKLCIWRCCKVIRPRQEKARFMFFRLGPRTGMLAIRCSPGARSR
jgi:hypothetical protein